MYLCNVIFEPAVANKHDYTVYTVIHTIIVDLPNAFGGCYDYQTYFILPYFLYLNVFRLVDHGLPLMYHTDFRFIPTKGQHFVIIVVQCYMAYTGRESNAKVYETTYPIEF